MGKCSLKMAFYAFKAAEKLPCCAKLSSKNFRNFYFAVKFL